ncbi:MAG: CYTH domain-containing protein [Candidatus Pacebacteria bacterium]|nr:CYTH domain-containing protein [Candidatus Paceibacterota bacterium]
MYEVEYKVEITKEERAKLVQTLTRDGFISRDTVHQDNYYTEATKLAEGGYNIKRYRDEGKNILYTEKETEIVDGNKITKETEREVTRAEFMKVIESGPIILKLSKDRQSWAGKYQNTTMHVDMDNVKFDHSENIRYFVEAEILVENKEEIPITKGLIIAFLKIIIEREELVEALGMFNMAFNKK